MGEAYEGVSDETKVQIMRQLLIQTPPGEFDSTFNDVRVLVNNDPLVKANINQILQEYNLEQHTAVKVGESDMVALSKEGQNQDGNFIAPNSKKLFTVDYLRKEATIVGNHQDSEEHEKLRTAIELKVQAYVEDHYPDGVATVLAKLADDEDHQTVISIIIESHSYMLQNFHTANWRETWSVSVDQSKGSVKVKGVAKVHVHYFEDGNVQKVTKRDFKTKLKFTNAETLADEVVDFLKKSTNEYQIALNEVYQKFQSETFKSLRRALPITHSKMNWDQIATYKVGAELTKNH